MFMHAWMGGREGGREGYGGMHARTSEVQVQTHSIDSDCKLKVRGCARLELRGEILSTSIGPSAASSLSRPLPSCCIGSGVSRPKRGCLTSGHQADVHQPFLECYRRPLFRGGAPSSGATATCLPQLRVCRSLPCRAYPTPSATRERFWPTSLQLSAASRSCDASDWTSAGAASMRTVPCWHFARLNVLLCSCKHVLKRTFSRSVAFAADESVCCHAKE